MGLMMEKPPPLHLSVIYNVVSGLEQPVDFLATMILSMPFFPRDFKCNISIRVATVSSTRTF